jgi:hypothetical protein
LKKDLAPTSVVNIVKSQTVIYSSAAEEEIAKQFPTKLWRVLKFSILHVVVIICFKIGGALFETRRLKNHLSSLLI